ncbi:unnamed protein product, partial [Effrenium voratum]
VPRFDAPNGLAGLPAGLQALLQSLPPEAQAAAAAAAQAAAQSMPSMPCTAPANSGWPPAMGCGMPGSGMSFPGMPTQSAPRVVPPPRPLQAPQAPPMPMNSLPPGLSGLAQGCGQALRPQGFPGGPRGGPYGMKGEGKGDFMKGDFMKGDFSKGDFSKGDFMKGDFSKGDFMKGEKGKGWTPQAQFRPRPAQALGGRGALACTADSATAGGSSEERAMAVGNRMQLNPSRAAQGGWRIWAASLADQEPMKPSMPCNGETEHSHVVVDLEEPGTKLLFPTPGPLTGVKTRGKAILKLHQVCFRYPGAGSALRDAELSVSQEPAAWLWWAPQAPVAPRCCRFWKAVCGQRTAACCGCLAPAFPTCASIRFRGSAITRRATALQYFLWRFADHRDKESVAFADELSPEEQARRMTVAWYLDESGMPLRGAGKESAVPEKICNRRCNGGMMEYEVKWQRKPETVWLSKDVLMDMGYAKLVQLEDDWQASSALSTKELTKDNVLKHLRCFMVDAAACQMPMGKLNRTLKIRIVLAAALWQHPHILILDELADYLDFEDLEALKFGIDRYAGGVILVTNNDQLCAMATEKWFMDDGVLHVEVLKEDARAHAKTSDVREKARQHILQIEKKIAQHRTKPLSDKELWLLEDELHGLKEELLLNDVELQDPDLEDAYAISGLGEVIDEQLAELLMAELLGFLRDQRAAPDSVWRGLEELPEGSAGLELEAEFAGGAAPRPGANVGPAGVCSLQDMGAAAARCQHRRGGRGGQAPRKGLWSAADEKVAEDRAAVLGVDTPEGFRPGEVRLRSLASAVRFYERLGYQRREEETAMKTPACPDPERPADADSEDGPCVPMARKCAPPSPRGALKMGPLLSPEQPAWCPAISRALEDGPTWPTREQLLPESAAA